MRYNLRGMEQDLVRTERLAITGVSHIEFHVSDLEASTDWYMLAVGLRQLKAEAPLIHHGKADLPAGRHRSAR
jgi:catechol-2,3-dioxygenase